MRATTTQGREIDLKRDAIDGLKTRLRGPVSLPGEAGYEESRTVWNAMIDRRPVAVARCLGGADVIAGVQFARATKTSCSASKVAGTTSRAWPQSMAR